MKTVRDVLNATGNEIISIAPHATVFEALRLLARKNVGAVLVMEGDRLVGIMSERDYARKVIMRGKSSKDTPVREIMTSQVLVVTPGSSLEDCMALMADKNIRHLPVVKEGEVSGVISIRDVVKALVAEKRRG
ncbi:MAG: hypothetical protein FD174_1491 [Geobacteraceae bacterium]|nr:MAG: hypothetical protein FD174_1491 [Geobacteraceae bacterium]